MMMRTQAERVVVGAALLGHVALLDRVQRDGRRPT